MKVKGRKLYYGWVVVAVCFFMVFVSLGFGSSTKGTYLKAISDDLGFKRSLLTLDSTIQNIVAAALSFFFGKIVLKLGPRRMIAIGHCFLVATFLIYFYASRLWHFYVGGAFLGIGINWTTTSVVAYIVEKWFLKNKGTIMSVVLAANGLGGILSENIITKIVFESSRLKKNSGIFVLISDFFCVEGWRLACLLSAFIFAISGITVVLFVRNKPKDFNDGYLKNDQIKKIEPEPGSISSVLRKPYFYMSGICVFCVGFIVQSTYTVAKAQMLDVGISAKYIVTVFSVNSLLITVAKILSGFLFDKFGLKLPYGIGMLCAIISIGSLAFVTANSASLAWIYSLLSALSMPMQTVLIPLLVSYLFERKFYAKILGYYLSLNFFGYACGIPFVNLFYDIFGTYKGILVTFASVMVATMIVSFISMTLAEKDKQGN